jgi:hypothetical protein
MRGNRYVGRKQYSTAADTSNHSMPRLRPPPLFMSCRTMLCDAEGQDSTVIRSHVYCRTISLAWLALAIPTAAAALVMYCGPLQRIYRELRLRHFPGTEEEVC